MPENPPIVLEPESYIARFKNRRKLMRLRPITDAELLEALRFLRAEMLAREISVSFKPKGAGFIMRCIQWLKNEQYKPGAKKKEHPYYVVPKTKLELYPDDEPEKT